MDRLMAGAFASRGLLDDALLVALVETGVPVWALDADRIEGPLGLRLVGRDDLLGRHAPTALPAGQVVVADAGAALAVLFGAPAAGHGVRRDTERMVLYAVRAPGVPMLCVEEALWTCLAVLEA